MKSYKLQNTVNFPKNKDDSSNKSGSGKIRQIPIQILAVFVLLILCGISIHCLITFIFSRYHHQDPPNFIATTPPTPLETIEKPWTHSNLFYISNFQWLRNNISICRRLEDASKKLLLILVNSARDNENERSMVRKSVDKMRSSIGGKNAEWTIRLIFMLGTGYEPINSGESDALLMEEKFLEQEYNVFGDLIMGNFMDTFDNLTLKTMMGFKWTLTHCPDATFVVKMDDDVFFNIPKFIEWRKIETQGFGNEKEVPELYCIPEVKKLPQRLVKDKGFEKLVSKSEWAGDVYPDYCNGAFYGMTVKLIQKMYDVSASVTRFRLEDIFFTGVVVDKVIEKYGQVSKRTLEIGRESEQTIKTICEKRVMRQTVSQEIGLVIRLERGKDMEKQMMCMAKEV